MSSVTLDNVTLIGVDCIDIPRIQKALDISTVSVDFGDIKLLSHIVNDDPRWVEIPQIGSIEEYSRFCIQNLSDYVDTDFALVVQYDGCLLNPSAWDSRFLDYDYIGAPIFVESAELFAMMGVDSVGHNHIVGNGGFSLRSKKLLDLTQTLSRDGTMPHYHPEDVVMSGWYKKILEGYGVEFAPLELAKKFSKECGVYTDQFGFHDLKQTDISSWTEKNPHYGL